jgi:serine/threonine protein kinase
MKQIPHDEDLGPWVDLPPHTNVVNCFHAFYLEEIKMKFSLSEMTNHGDMYQHISSQHLNLGIKVPLHYMEVIFDCMIQTTLAMEFAHNNNLVHGNFGLQTVCISKDGDTNIYKLTNFLPTSSLKLPTFAKANSWPFMREGQRNSKTFQIEMLKLKDIYSVGICLLELMIGRHYSNKYSISIDSVPLTWAEYAESTPLIEVLISCIQLNSTTQSKGKLAAIRNLLIKEHAKYFNKPFYKQGEPFVGKLLDVLNKKALAAFLHESAEGDHTMAEKYWKEALEKSPKHFDTLVNFALFKWRTAQIDDDRLKEELATHVFTNKHKGHSLEGIIKIALGDKREGLKILEAYN